jgi:hypothetical protein
MRKIAFAYIFSVLAFSLIAGCQKDEMPIDPIVGTWEYAETSDDFSRTVTLTFYADKTGLSTVKYVVFGKPETRNNNFTYIADAGNLTMVIGFEFNTAPYSISQNELTMTYLGEVLVLKKK